MTAQGLYYLIRTLVALVAIPFHEAGHALAAWLLGDDTAKREGRLSLNPLKHIDPFGTVILPLCMMLMNGPVFGYAKPVPYNPSYFKDPKKGDVIVGLAGPAANLALAFVGDGVYELMVRERLVCQANRPVNELHKQAVAMVRAEAQAAAMDAILPRLTEEEAAVFRRGRNAHTARSGGDYHRATGLEALFGYLYLRWETDRIRELFEAAFCAGEQENPPV